MRLWEKTIEDLVEGVPILPGSDPPFFEVLFDDTTIEELPEHPGFATANAVGGNGLADLVLIKRSGGVWEAVGCYVGETILLDESARRQGLAEELALRVAENRPDDYRMSYLSNAGHSLLKRAHRLSVKRALARGEKVPEKVLVKYKDLKDPAQ